MVRLKRNIIGTAPPQTNCGCFALEYDMVQNTAGACQENGIHKVSNLIEKLIVGGTWA